MIRTMVVAAAVTIAVPATATGFQTVFDFEDQTVGATSLSLGSNPVNQGSGGVIALSAAAHSGTRVYQGTTLSFVVDDEIDYDWPAVGGWITATDAVTLTGWHYNPDTRAEDLAGVAILGAGATDAYLALGNDMDRVRVTKWQFASTSPFTLDDLTVGLVDVPGGIPEPGVWALLLTGFGLVGARHRYVSRFGRSHASAFSTLTPRRTA